MNWFWYCEDCQQVVNNYDVNNNLHKCGPIVKKEKPKSGYWYKFYIDECVLCGAGGTERVRQYSPKPDNPSDRYEYTQNVCQYHFM